MEKEQEKEIEFNINGNKYIIYTNFLVQNSNYFKKYIENNNNKNDKVIIIKNSKDENIDNIYIEQIIKWFYHKQFNYIKYLSDSIDNNYNFNILLEYYYICKFLEIEELNKKCIEIINEYLNMLCDNCINLLKLLQELKLMESDGNFKHLINKNYLMGIKYDIYLKQLVEPIFLLLLKYKPLIDPLKIILKDKKLLPDVLIGKKIL